MIGYGLSGFAPKETDWRKEAAQHHSLYRSWTIASLSPSEAELVEQVKRASATVGVPIPIEGVSQTGALALKRAQMLGVGDQRLAHVVFAAPGMTPVALWIINRRQGRPVDADEMTLETLMMSGMAAAIWKTDEAEFLLVGGDDRAEIERYARAFWSVSVKHAVSEGR